MAANVPYWCVPGTGVSVYAATAVAANLFLVPDATVTKGAKIPVTSSTILTTKGVSRTAIAAGTYGTTFNEPGSTVVVKASGTITRGDIVFVDTSAGKEGRAKTYVNFATNGVVTLVGVADFSAASVADGDLCSILLTVATPKTA
jgi:hypothetical protein